MQLFHPITGAKISLNEFKEFYGIPDLFINDDENLTNLQSDFYNDVKFPNYNNINDYASLIDKAKTNSFIKKLDDEIGCGKVILEAGCGTGQLSLFLSRYQRKIYGIDLSKGSLIEAQKFSEENNINNVHFFRMNIFNMFFAPNTFDVIISNGVLHHTSDCRKAFSKLTKVLKPNGLIIIGLYHRYGRIVQKIRQFFFPLLKENLKFFDKRFRENISDVKKYAWFLDQYNNPYESTHTYKEVAQWFKEENIEFLSSLPFDQEEDKKLFEKKPLKKNLDLFFNEIKLMIDPQQIYEGGFFIMIGKKIKQ
jgi:ubiquinone/menaquinone biosynthesis C-methylase UbiE